MFTTDATLFQANPPAGRYQDYVGGTHLAMAIFHFVADKDDLLGASKKVAYPLIAWACISTRQP